MKRRTSTTPGDRWSGHFVVLEGGRQDPYAPAPADAVRVVVAGSEGLVRAGIAALLQADDAVTVVGEATDGEQALAMAHALRPDVVVIDVDLDVVDGLEATRRLKADPESADVKVVLLVSQLDDADLFEALRAGVSGVLAKDAAAEELPYALRVVTAGEAQLSPSITRRLIEALAAQPELRPPTVATLDELTPREREVVGLVALGLSNAEIAERLVVSVATAKSHVSRSMLKLQAGDRAKLVALAYRTGLVAPPRQPVPLAGAGHLQRPLAA
ncbi:MAG TPA: response regulator transcription factor [Baekduia sp.]